MSRFSVGCEGTAAICQELLNGTSHLGRTCYHHQLRTRSSPHQMAQSIDFSIPPLLAENRRLLSADEASTRSSYPTSQFPCLWASFLDIIGWGKKEEEKNKAKTKTQPSLCLSDSQKASRSIKCARGFKAVVRRTRAAE